MFSEDNRLAVLGIKKSTLKKICETSRQQADEARLWPHEGCIHMHMVICIRTLNTLVYHVCTSYCSCLHDHELSYEYVLEACLLSGHQQTQIFSSLKIS